MLKACQISPQFRLGNILRKPLDNQAIAEQKRSLSTRGPLPWENIAQFANTPQKKLRKKEFADEKHTSNECNVLQRPKRNTYEWVIDEEAPGVTKIMDKTMCEIRRLKKCLSVFRSCPQQCDHLAPDCSKITKTYPMSDATHKGIVRGFAGNVKTKCDCPKTPKIKKTIEEKKCIPCSFINWKPKSREQIEQEIKERMKRNKPLECHGGMIIPQNPNCKCENNDPFKTKPCPESTQKAVVETPQTEIKIELPTSDWDFNCK